MSRTLIFSGVLLGATSFSLVLLYSRLVKENLGLVEVVDLQSASAFYSFVIQAGLRAGIRKEYLLGHKRLVSLVERFICVHWLWCGAFFSLVIIAALGKGNFILYMLNAIFSLLIGLRLVQRQLSQAAYFSFYLFVLNVFVGLLYVELVSWPDYLKALVSEVLALLIGLAALRFYQYPMRHIKRGFYGLKSIVFRYLGLQASSFLIVFIVYLMAQFVLVASTYDDRILVLYSDAVIVAGAVTMLLSRVVLLFEEQLVRSGRVALFIVLSHFIFLILAVCIGLFRVGFGGEFLLFFLLLLGLLGRYTFASISGFINERLRSILNLVLCSVAALQIIFLGLHNFYRFTGGGILIALSINLFSVSLVLALIYLIRSGAYIHAKSSPLLD